MDNMIEMTNEKENEPRSVVSVIKKMMEIIPENETVLINDLETFMNGLWNKAPEILKTSCCWIPLTQIMTKNITQIDKVWKEEIVKISNNTV